jgi:cysteinyl-tRNA synthetase
MAKSVGNVVRVDEALAQVPGEAVRLWMLGTHYHQPVDYSEEALAEAKRTLDRFYGALDRTGVDDFGSRFAGDPDSSVVAALADDLNTPEAIAVLHGLLNELNKAQSSEARREITSRLIGSSQLLGLLYDAPAHWLRGQPAGLENVLVEAIEEIRNFGEAIEILIAVRADLRKARMFQQADSIRRALGKLNVVLEDGPQGTTWRRA